MNKVAMNFLQAMNFFYIVLLGFSFVSTAAFAEMGVPIQLKLKSPSGTFPTASGLEFKLLVLTPASNCILREEIFSAQTIVSGRISLNLGSGLRGVSDPNLSLNQVYDNSKSKIGLSCVDANNNVVLTGQVYNPTSIDQRIIRVVTTIAPDIIIVNFNMRATPYAIQAESVGGKVAADIVVNNANTQMNQTNLNDLLFDATRFNNLKNIATSGQANSATNFTGTLAGDISGTQGATSVDRIKGVAVSSAAPVAGNVLQFNGTQYVPVAIPSAPVTSVAGRTSAVVLSSSDISGLGGAAALNVGAAAGTVAAGDDARFSELITSARISDGTITNIDISAAASIDATKVGATGVVSNAEYNFLDGVTSSIQTQLNARLPLDGGTMTGTLIARVPTAAANTASLKLPAGTLMTTPEAGAVESNGQILYYTDSAGVRRVIPLETVITKTVTQNVNNSTTLVNDNAFTFTAVANTRYHIKIFIKCSNANNAMQIKWTFLLPSGTMEVSAINPGSGTANAGSWLTGASLSVASPVLGMVTATGNQVAIIDGLISVGGTGGAVTLQWAQQTAVAANLSFMAGSYMVYKPE